jgi:hypothetical protein
MWQEHRQKFACLLKNTKKQTKRWKSSRQIFWVKGAWCLLCSTSVNDKAVLVSCFEVSFWSGFHCFLIPDDCQSLCGKGALIDRVGCSIRIGSQKIIRTKSSGQKSTKNIWIIVDRWPTSPTWNTQSVRGDIFSRLSLQDNIDSFLGILQGYQATRSHSCGMLLRFSGGIPHLYCVNVQQQTRNRAIETKGPCSPT